MLICMEDTIDMVLDTVDTMVMVLVLDTASYACKSFNMMNLIYLACLSVVMAAPPSPPVYPTPAPTQEYNPDIGQTNVGGYGVNKDPYCHMVEKVVFENQYKEMVEVWKQNLKESLDDFKAKLKENPLFVAIDTEFTGLQTGNAVKPRYFDVPQQRYAQARESANAYTLIQLGMAVFLPPLPDLENGPIRVHIYTLNLFPSTKFRNSFDYNFRCQTRSLEFLASNGFDFNRLFTDAVPYMTQEDEQQLKQRQLNMKKRKQMKKEERAKNKKRVEVTRRYDLEFIRELKEKLTRFKAELEENPESSIDVECRNAFHRLLVYDTINFDFPTIRYQKLRRPETNEQYILCTKLLIDRAVGRKEDEVARDKEIDELLWDQKGMNWFVEALSKSGAPVIAHNGLLDILHIYSTTRGSPSEKFEEFAADFLRLFSLFFDTKVLATKLETIRAETEGSTLKALNELTESWDGSSLDVSEEAEKRSEHHAGYDALLTGKILLKFLTKVGVPVKHDWYKSEILETCKNHSALFMSPVNLAFDIDSQKNWRNVFQSVAVLRCRSFLAQSDLELRFKRAMREEEEIRAFYRPSENEQLMHETLVSFPKTYEGNEIKNITRKVCVDMPGIMEACLLLDDIDGNAPFWTRTAPAPDSLRTRPRSSEVEDGVEPPKKKMR